MGWEKKYPILAKYLEFEGVDKYRGKIKEIFKEVQGEYNLSTVDTVLVVKDILAKEYLRVKEEEEKAKQEVKKQKKQKRGKNDGSKNEGKSEN